jgi:hypothetical protein
MNDHKIKFISLITIAIFTGLLWRWEVDYHGWRGLTWISYFHFALPAGFLLFILWVNVCLMIRISARLILNLLAGFSGVLNYYLAVKSLAYNYSRGPEGLWLLFTTSGWEFQFYKYIAPGMIILLPLSIYLAFRLIKFQIPVKYLLFSITGLILSFPLSITILWIINHKGGPDIIHSVKSGIVFPFILFSLGLPIVYAEKN